MDCADVHGQFPYFSLRTRLFRRAGQLIASEHHCWCTLEERGRWLITDFIISFIIISFVMSQDIYYFNYVGPAHMHAWVLESIRVHYYLNRVYVVVEGDHKLLEFLDGLPQGLFRGYLSYSLFSFCSLSSLYHHRRREFQKEYIRILIPKFFKLGIICF